MDPSLLPLECQSTARSMFPSFLLCINLGNYSNRIVFKGTEVAFNLHHLRMENVASATARPFFIVSSIFPIRKRVWPRLIICLLPRCCIIRISERGYCRLKWVPCSTQHIQECGFQPAHIKWRQDCLFHSFVYCSSDRLLKNLQLFQTPLPFEVLPFDHYGFTNGTWPCQVVLACTEPLFQQRPLTLISHSAFYDKL